jgi:hypothetical protein
MLFVHAIPAGKKAQDISVLGLSVQRKGGGETL